MELLTEFMLVIYRMFTPFRTARLERNLVKYQNGCDKLKKQLQLIEIELKDYKEKCFVVLYDGMCHVKIKADNYSITEIGGILEIEFYEEFKHVRTISIKKELFIGIV